MRPRIVFIFCMDRCIYVLNIYNVEIENGKKKKLMHVLSG